ncbi:MAG: leucine-rich repeat protein [Bacteroidetes bacterium]|uniref:Leucine-rich repeat protein n=1 Tax=Candidatus Pullibacteroides excrementavium TaxID=2840905 RepID=A0A9D9DUC1_9BACT|nr:leucine-rich repeat protein [Candidatus Pullibacteroides excrementavium]
MCRVTRIGDGALQICYNLTSIEMPAGLTTVGGYAFLGCSDLTTIEMPAGLTSIGWDAFFGGQTVLRRFSWRTSCMFAMAACLLSP